MVNPAHCRSCYLWHNRPKYTAYWGPAGPHGDSPLVVPIPLGPRPLPCYYEGPIEEVCGAGEERMHVRRCELFDVQCTRGPGRARYCEGCASYRHPVPALPKRVGVVVGCFGWPELAELQVRLIREHNGHDVPILLCDDGSPFADSFAGVSIRLGASTRRNPRRLGHYAGDLSVFRHGMEWAQERGLEHLCKISQRMLIDRLGWIAEASATLTSSGRGTLASSCVEGKTNLYIRSELVMMDVTEWSRPEMMEQLKGEKLKNPTELRLNHAVQQVSNGKADWPHLSAVRTQRCPGFIWHSTNSREDYDAIAKRHGITLPLDFHTYGAVRGMKWAEWMQG